MTTRISKTIFLLAAIIFFLNLIFRSLTISDCSLWYDEAFSIFHAQKDIFRIKVVASYDIAPPFFNYVLHYWIQLFGLDEWNIRMLSVVCVSLAASLLFLFTCRFINFKTAIVSSVLFFTSNQIFFYAQEARTYSLLILFSVVSAFLFFELLFKPKWYWILLLGLINWAAVYSHYFFLFILIIQFITILFSKNKTAILFLLLSFTVTAIMFGNWMLRIYEVFLHGRISSSFTPVYFSDLIQLIVQLLNGKLFVTLILILFFAGLFIYVKRKNLNENKFFSPKALYLILWALLPLSVLFAKGRGELFIPRYLLFTLPAVFILLSYFISKIVLNQKIFTAIILVLFIDGMFSINYKVTKGYDYKHAVPFVVANKNDSTMVIVQTDAMSQLFAYYYDKNIFMNFDSVELNLAKHKVIFKNDSTAMKNEITNRFSKVILLQTFNTVADKNKTMLAFLNKRFANSNVNQNFSEARITIFTNPK